MSDIFHTIADVTGAIATVANPNNADPVTKLDTPVDPRVKDPFNVGILFWYGVAALIVWVAVTGKIPLTSD